MVEPVATLAALAATTLGGFMTLADQAGSAPWPDWAALPANLVAVALLLYVVLTGKWRRREDCEAEAAAALEAAEREAAATAELAAAKVAGSERVLDALRDRLDAVVADRDAWRSAHSQEVAARVAAERAGRELLDGQNVTVRLLGALESILAAKPGV